MAVKKEFSKNYIEDGILYKNAENKFKTMRKKFKKTTNLTNLAINLLIIIKFRPSRYG